MHLLTQYYLLMINVFLGAKSAIRCPPYSLNFARYGLPQCQPYQTVHSANQLKAILNSLKCVGYGSWKVSSNKGCSSPEQLPMGMVIEYPCKCYLGAKCKLNCKPGYELVGYQYITCMAQTSLWDISSTCMQEFCGVPVVPNNMVVVANKCSMLETGKCELQCSTGYFMVGKKTIRCLSTNNWSRFPKCLRVCKLETIPEYLKMTQNCSGNEDVLCAVECKNPALTFYGPNNIKCLPSGGWSELPICGCSSTTVPPNIVLNGTCTMAATTSCGASCAISFVKDDVSEAKLFCGADGAWDLSQSIKCLRMCRTPPTLPAGLKLSGTCSGKENEECDATCTEDGYRLIGSTFHCLHSGQFSELPHCVPPQECVRDIFSDIMVVNQDCNFRAGITCTVSCNNEKYKLNGVATITCGSSGAWSAMPTCLRICSPPQNDTNIHIQEQCDTTEGKTCVLQCNDGYAPADPVTGTCLRSGEWLGAPTCVKVCPPLPPHEQITSVTTCSRNLNAECELQCTDSTNYIILPTNKVQCEPPGMWSVMPECKKLCLSPIIPEGSSFELVNVQDCTNFIVGTKCAIKCIDSNLLLSGSGFIECQEDGEFLGENACSRPCGMPTLPTGVDYVDTCPSDQANAECPLQCTNVRAANRNGLAKCVLGDWTITINCEVQCPDPVANLSNDKGLKAPCAGRSPGSKCIIICNDNTALMDEKKEATITCDNEGVWSEAPTCAYYCEPLVLPAHLRLVSSPCTRIAGSLCEVTCVDPEAQVFGESSFNCRFTAWNPTFMPTCSKVCGNMQFSDSNVEFDGLCNRKVHHKCKVKCASGYKLEGRDYMECLETMSWSAQPKCSRRCSEIAPPLQIEPGFTCTREVNSTCKITCQDLAQWLDSHLITCNNNLEWDPVNTCVDRNILCSLEGGPRMKLQWPCELEEICKVYCDKPMYYVPMTTKNEANCGDNGVIVVDQFRCKKVKLEKCENMAEKIGSDLMLPGGQESLEPFTSANVACADSNKVLKGKTFVMCQFDGTITTLPQCLTACNPNELVIPGNREVSSTCTTVLEGEYCAIKCNGDNTPDTTIMAKCVSGGTWEDIPNCVPIFGDRVTCDQDELPSNLKLLDTSVIYTAVTCDNPRLTLVGPNLIQCSYNGNWSPLPTCEMASHYAKCFTPSIPDFAEVENRSDCPRRWRFFEMATCKLKLTCGAETIYRTLYCLSTGEWTRAYCDSPY